MNPKEKTPFLRNIAFVIFSVFVIWLIFLFLNGPWHFQDTGASAYEACRNAAMRTKSYDIWSHWGKDKQDGATASIQFYDGTNYLSCSASQRGPVWVVTSAFSTILGIPCPENYANCPRWDYHGVNP